MTADVVLDHEAEYVAIRPNATPLRCLVRAFNQRPLVIVQQLLVPRTDVVDDLSNNLAIWAVELLVEPLIVSLELTQQPASEPLLQRGPVP